MNINRNSYAYIITTKKMPKFLFCSLRTIFEILNNLACGLGSKITLMLIYWGRLSNYTLENFQNYYKDLISQSF